MRLDPFSPPPPTQWNILSLGAGVQSSTLALMAAHGEVTPDLDAAIFADTQAEPRAVYRWLDWLEGAIAAAPHPFPVHRVTAGNLAASALDMRTSGEGRLYSKTALPVFLAGNGEREGRVTRRACTEDFKIVPIRRAIRQIAGIRRAQHEVTVTQWIGISWDEMQRMRDSRDGWCQNRFPLIEQRLRRDDCVRWMRDHGYPEPPRSACTFCPFHDDHEWRHLRESDPEAFAQAAVFERDLQRELGPVFSGTPFLHRSLVPLDEVDFSTAEERGQLGLFQGECEGMCGV